jgi:hypothetical protein
MEELEMNKAKTKMLCKTIKKYEYNGGKTKITESSEAMLDGKRKYMPSVIVTEIDSTSVTVGSTTTTTNTKATSFYRSSGVENITEITKEIKNKFKDATYNTTMVTVNGELKSHLIRKYNKGMLNHEFDVIKQTLINNTNVQLEGARKSVHSIDDNGFETVTYYENDRIVSVYKSLDKNNRTFVKSESYEYDDKGRRTLFKKNGEIEISYVQLPNGTVMIKSISRPEDHYSGFSISSSSDNDLNRFNLKCTIKVSIYDERKERYIMNHVKIYSDDTFSECIEEYIEHFEYGRIIDIDGNMYNTEKRILSHSNGVVDMHFSKKSDDNTINIVSAKHYVNGILENYFQMKRVSEAPSQDGTLGRILSESTISRYFK